MSPFKAVSMTGWTLDEKGEKMSKSLGNVLYADDVLKEVEADTLRYYYCWNIAPWETQKFSLANAKDLRRVMSVMWNTAMFAISYADLQKMENKVVSSDLKEEDRWIISRVNSLAESVTNDLENFRLHYAGRDLGDFILNDFSRWYIKIIRNRLSPWSHGKDKDAAQYTVLYVLDVLVRLMAPITPFISEKIYQMMFRGWKGAPESVHLSDWPKPDRMMMNKELETEMETCKAIVEAVNSLRQRDNIKSRWPVAEIYFKPKDKKVEASAKKLEHVIKVLGNSEKLVVSDSMPKKDRKIFEQGELCFGEVLMEKAFLRELSRSIQVMRKKEMLKVNDTIKLWLSSDGETEEILKKMKAEMIKSVGASEVHIEDSGRTEKETLDFEGKKVKIFFEKSGK
jgi:isoleucyl-tRNA synthetase